MPEDHVNFVLQFTHFLTLALENIYLLHQSIVLLLQGTDQGFGGLVAGTRTGRRPRCATEGTCG